MRENNTIIIFDDDEDILTICTYILEENGWQVFTFKNCADVTDKVTGIMPAVILMDNWIPDDGGIIATQRIKSNEILKDIPVIYFSANSDIASLSHAAGADAYLAKPFELEDLEKVILLQNV
jgi:DNA-binding NtrC family response regulator